jgi:hypothetical protein
MPDDESRDRASKAQEPVDQRPLGYIEVLRLGKKIAATSATSKVTVLCPCCKSAEPCLTIRLDRRGRLDVDCPNCGKDKVILHLAREGLWPYSKTEAKPPPPTEAECDVLRWGKQFVPHRRALLESDAWRDLDRRDRHTDRIIIGRLELEHLRHGGRDNGRLRVSYGQFIEAGARRQDIPLAKRRLEEHGLIRVESGSRRSPDYYWLTYLPVDNAAPVDDWRLWKFQPVISTSRKSRPLSGTASGTTGEVPPAAPSSRTPPGKRSWAGAGETDEGADLGGRDQPQTDPNSIAWLLPNLGQGGKDVLLALSSTCVLPAGPTEWLTHYGIGQQGEDGVWALTEKGEALVEALRREGGLT